VATATRSAHGRMTPEREGQLYEAVLALVRETGYERLTLDAVAARAHVSKATLYRQWNGKATLVAHALKATRPPVAQTADTGSLRGDFAAIVTRLDDRRASQDTAMMRSLMHAAHTTPELMRALREVLIEPERQDLQQMLRRAVARGEVSPGNPALDYVMHMMVGAFIARDLIDDRPPDQAFVRSYIDAVILPALGLTPEPADRG
jgi:AcrR family transcriptional regulator